MNVMYLVMAVLALIIKSQLTMSPGFKFRIENNSSLIQMQLQNDNSGNLYIMDRFDQRVYFYHANQSLAFTLDPINNTLASYVVKYSTDGDFLWVIYSRDFVENDYRSLALDSNSNLLISGFTRSFNFSLVQANGVEKIVQQFNESFVGFLVKVDTLGNYMWHAHVQGNSLDSIDAVRVDGNNNVILAGRVQNDNHQFYDSSQSQAQILKKPFAFNTGIAFLVKLNESGIFQWSLLFGVTNFIIPRSLVIDSQDNIITQLIVRTTSVNIGSSQNGSNQFNLTSNGLDIDIAIIKLNSQGIFLWANQLYNVSSFPSNLNVDSVDSIIASGVSQTQNLQLYSYNISTSINLTSQFGFFGYIVAMDQYGHFLWTNKVESNLNGQILGQAVGNDGSVYVGGSAQFFLQSYDNNMNIEFNLTNQDDYFAYIIGFNSTGFPLFKVSATGSALDNFQRLSFFNQTLLALGVSESPSLNLVDSMNNTKAELALSASRNRYVVQYNFLNNSDVLVTQSSSQISTTTTQLLSETSSLALISSFTQQNVSSQTSMDNSTVSSQTSQVNIDTTYTLTINDSHVTVFNSSLSSSQVFNSSSSQNTLTGSLFDSLVLSQGSSANGQSSLNFTFSTSSFAQSHSSTQSNSRNLDGSQQNTDTFIFDLNNILIIAGSAVGFIIAVAVAIIMLRWKSKKSRNFNSSTLITEDQSSVVMVESITQTASAYTSTLVGTSLPLSIPAFLEAKYDLDFRCKKSIIAQGGLASIYECEILHQDLKKRVGSVSCVVKVLNNSNGNLKPQLLKAFYQELSMYYKFMDSGLFPLVFAYTENPASIVMKYYKTGSLSKFVHNGLQSFDYSKRNIFKLLRQFCQGLQVLHVNGFAHLDIKSDNILLDIDELGQLSPIITDFGISQLTDQSFKAVKEFSLSTLKGITVSYASPEALIQFRAQQVVQKQDDLQKYDIYSTAVLMYEILQRQKPWEL